MKLEVIRDNNESTIDKIIKLNNLTIDQINQLKSNDIEISNLKDDSFIKAKERILLAKENNEKVFVAGDYDCDGVMATTIVKDLLDRLGIVNGYYIPSRFKEGYGLNANTIDLIHEKGYSLVITVDNGVKAYDALNKCKEYGIDVIVTDHHTMDKELDVYTILHPQLMDKQYEGLAGAGVALFLSRMFFNIDYHIVLAMIATIGDMMPVWNENRIIIKKGLELLNNGNYNNIKLLMNCNKVIDETEISFNLVPKINSIGRLENINVNQLVKYFSIDDTQYIQKFSQLINEQNELRKSMSKDMTEVALNNINLDNDILITVSDTYHEGICGLVAGAITNKYYKPSIVLSYKEGIYKGSGRSNDEVNLYEELNKYNDLYMAFGGHSKAIGVTIHEDNYNKFKDIINNIRFEHEETNIQAIELTKDELTIEHILEINTLKPFGVGFKLPLFYIENKNPLSYTKIKDMYPKWLLQNDPKIEAICFDSTIDISKNYLLFEPTINEFNGKRSVSLLVKNLV